MQTEMITQSNQRKPIQINEAIFNTPFNEGLVHQVVTAYMAGGREGTKAQKTRSEVSGGGKKPWRQKGTGRARAGTIRSPLWRKGGKIFAAKPRDFSQKVNRKMYRYALAAIMAELLRQGRLLVVENFDLAEPKTKLLAEKLNTLEINKVLIVIDEISENLFLAARNLPHVELCPVTRINPVSLISFDHIVVTQDALKKIEAKIGYSHE